MNTVPWVEILVKIEVGLSNLLKLYSIVFFSLWMAFSVLLLNPLPDKGLGIIFVQYKNFSKNKNFLVFTNRVLKSIASA